MEDSVKPHAHYRISPPNLDSLCVSKQFSRMTLIGGSVRAEVHTDYRVVYDSSDLGIDLGISEVLACL